MLGASRPSQAHHPSRHAGVRAAVDATALHFPAVRPVTSRLTRPPCPTHLDLRTARMQHASRPIRWVQAVTSQPQRGMGGASTLPRPARPFVPFVTAQSPQGAGTASKPPQLRPHGRSTPRSRHVHCQDWVRPGRHGSTTARHGCNIQAATTAIQSAFPALPARHGRRRSARPDSMATRRLLSIQAALATTAWPLSLRVPGVAHVSSRLSYAARLYQRTACGAATHLRRDCVLRRVTPDTPVTARPCHGAAAAYRPACRLQHRHHDAAATCAPRRWPRGRSRLHSRRVPPGRHVRQGSALPGRHVRHARLSSRPAGPKHVVQSDLAMDATSTSPRPHLCDCVRRT